MGKELNFAAVAWLGPALPRLETVRSIVGMLAISLFFTNLGFKSGTASGSTRDARRRVRLVWLGASVGLTPCFILAVISLARGRDFGAGVPAWVL